MGESLDVLAFARGINEMLVLAVLREEPKHGYQVALELERSSGGRFTLQHGTLYPILHRLERERLIRGSWEEAGGRRRKVYGLTAAGRRKLETDSARCHELFRGLLSVIEEGGGRGEVRVAVEGSGHGS
jgi:DNA-binding PadR family transcriptional regulator